MFRRDFLKTLSAFAFSPLFNNGQAYAENEDGLTPFDLFTQVKLEPEMAPEFPLDLLTGSNKKTGISLDLPYYCLGVTDHLKVPTQIRRVIDVDAKTAKREFDTLLNQHATKLLIVAGSFNSKTHPKHDLITFDFQSEGLAKYTNNVTKKFKIGVKPDYKDSLIAPFYQESHYILADDVTLYQDIGFGCLDFEKIFILEDKK